MKKFKLILMVVLVLAFSSPKAFADWASDLKSLGSQVTSGVNGVFKGDWGGVSAGLTNFATTTPLISQSYSLGQITGNRLSNINTGLGITYATVLSRSYSLIQTTGRLSGLNTGLSTTSNKVSADDCLNGISKQITSGIRGLKDHDYAGVKAGLTNFVKTTPVLNRSYGMVQAVGKLSGISTCLITPSQKAFAEDYLNGINKQITSGISGLKDHDYAGVKAGLTNFVKTTPVLSQSYDMVQIAGSRLSGINTGLSTSTDLLVKFYGMNQIAGSRISKTNIDQGTTYTILGAN